MVKHHETIDLRQTTGVFDMLQRYSEFSPTGFDPTGLNLPDKQDWFVAPVGLNRDSGDLAISNWEVTVRELEGISPEGENWEIHRFGHWLCGWCEIIIVMPGSPCNDAMNETLGALENYPILDEMDYCEREWEAIAEAWGYTDLGDKVDILSKHDLNIFAARRDEVPSGLTHYEDFFEAS
jgi:hypothetical protein